MDQPGTKSGLAKYLKNGNLGERNMAFIRFRKSGTKEPEAFTKLGQETLLSLSTMPLTSASLESGEVRLRILVPENIFNSVIRIDGDLNIQLPETIELKTDVLKKRPGLPIRCLLFTWLQKQITEGDQNENHRTRLMSGFLLFS